MQYKKYTAFINCFMSLVTIRYLSYIVYFWFAYNNTLIILVKSSFYINFYSNDFITGNGGFCYDWFRSVNESFPDTHWIKSPYLSMICGVFWERNELYLRLFFSPYYCKCWFISKFIRIFFSSHSVVSI